MTVLMPAFVDLLQTNAQDLLSPDFFEDRESKVIGISVRCVKPVLRFPDGAVEPGYNIGTRGNGVDVAKWPEDLTVEIVT